MADSMHVLGFHKVALHFIDAPIDPMYQIFFPLTHPVKKEKIVLGIRLNIHCLCQQPLFLHGREVCYYLKQKPNMQVEACLICKQGI